MNIAVDWDIKPQNNNNKARSHEENQKQFFWREGSLERA